MFLLALNLTSKMHALWYEEASLRLSWDKKKKKKRDDGAEKDIEYVA